MDSEDHVKIGDFGLATSSPLKSMVPTVSIDVLDGTPHAAHRAEKSSEVISNSGQLTGQIGTALYVAPELKASCKFNRFFRIATLDLTYLTISSMYLLDFK